MPPTIDEAAIKASLSSIAKTLTVIGGNAAKAGDSIPVHVSDFPTSLAVAVVSERTISVDQVTKDVMFEDFKWPASPINAEPVKAGQPLITITGTIQGIPGSIGRLEVRIPEVKMQDVPVTAAVTWAAYNDPGCTTAGTGVEIKSNNTSANILLEPPIEELTNSPISLVQSRWIQATITLSIEINLPKPTATDPAAVETKKIDAPAVKTPCIEVKTPALGLPTVLVLFDASGYGGAGLIVVPTNSPFAGVSNATDVVQGIRDSVANVGAIAALATMISLVKDVANAVAAAGVLRMVVSDAIADLGSIAMWSHSTWFGSATVTANDLFGSLVILSGRASKGARLYNRTNYISGSSPLHDGGAFTVKAGESRVSKISALDSQSPTSEPVNTVTDVVAPAGSTTFTNHLSSLSWV